VAFLLGLLIQGLVADSSNEVAHKQLCLNWTQFVVSEVAAGVRPAAIDREGARMSRSSRKLGSKAPIADLCGTAVEIAAIRSH
jgi:hypothetical protein